MECGGVYQAGCEIAPALKAEGAAEGAVQKPPRFFPPDVEAPAEGVFRSAEWRNPGHVVEQLIGVCNAALRIVIGSAQRGKATRNAHRRQSRIQQVLAAVDHAGQRLTVWAAQDRGGVE